MTRNASHVRIGAVALAAAVVAAACGDGGGGGSGNRFRVVGNVESLTTAMRAPSGAPKFLAQLPTIGGWLDLVLPSAVAQGTCPISTPAVLACLLSAHDANGNDDIDTNEITDSRCVSVNSSDCTFDLSVRLLSNDDAIDFFFVQDDDGNGGADAAEPVAEFADPPDVRTCRGDRIRVANSQIDFEAGTFDAVVTKERDACPFATPTPTGTELPTATPSPTPTPEL
jgi:hypothetical protein